ncbi:preprotein translocase subunit SecE [Pseudarcicella hirudinis]
MDKLSHFVKASWEEVTQNVTWPKFSELQSSSFLVLIASLISP